MSPIGKARRASAVPGRLKPGLRAYGPYPESPVRSSLGCPSVAALRGGDVATAEQWPQRALSATPEALAELRTGE